LRGSGEQGVIASSTLANVLEAPVPANASQFISGGSRARLGTVRPLSFVFHIPPSQLVAPGTYSDQISIRIYSAYNDQGAPQATANVTFQAAVAPVAGLCLVPTGSGFNNSSTSQTLDFGNLAEGQSKNCDLLVLKNTSCTVGFTSASQGVLKTTPTSSSDQIPYVCTVNGSALNLAQTASVSLPPGVSPTQDGTRLPVNITIGAIGNAAAGNYRDDITVTVTVQ
jgi:hypothetical protein